MKALNRVEEDRAVDFADDSIARMIAGENLVIMYHDKAGVKFNHLTRVLALPMALKLDRVERIAIRASGAASALFATGSTPDILSSIIEEIRVNLLLMKKHRGIMRVIFNGNNRIFDRGVYGITRNQFAQSSLFDRVVLYFRLGLGAGIPISSDERVLIDQIEALENTAQSVEFARTLSQSDFQVNGMSKQEAQFADSLSAKAYSQIESLLSSDQDRFGRTETSGIIYDVSRFPGFIKNLVETSRASTFVPVKTEEEFDSRRLPKY